MLQHPGIMIQPRTSVTWRIQFMPQESIPLENIVCPHFEELMYQLLIFQNKN